MQRQKVIQADLAENAHSLYEIPNFQPVWRDMTLSAGGQLDDIDRSCLHSNEIP